MFVHHHGIVDRVTALHTGSPGLIPGRVRNFNSYLEFGMRSIQPREDN